MFWYYVQFCHFCFKMIFQIQYRIEIWLMLDQPILFFISFHWKFLKYFDFALFWNYLFFKIAVLFIYCTMDFSHHSPGFQKESI